MTKVYQRILIHPDAAPQPLQGAPCNGCGVCCLLEPCPLGIALSRSRHGACVALRWHGDERQYRCGALSEPAQVLQTILPRPLPRMAPWVSAGLAPALRHLARRWIAVGQGCDSSVESHGCEESAAANSSTMRVGVPPGRL